MGPRFVDVDDLCKYQVCGKQNGNEEQTQLYIYLYQAVAYSIAVRPADALPISYPL